MFFLFGIKVLKVVNISNINYVGVTMFVNIIKPILSYDVIIVFLIISYILTFRTSKSLKRKNFHRDYKIVRFTGIVYGLIALSGIIIKYI